MTKNVPNYLLIGNGRVAKHFQHYFSLLQLPFLTWHRHQSINTLKQILPLISHILLLIRDDAITAFIEKHLTSQPAYLIHFSGSLVLPNAHGAHPLMTFSPDLYDQSVYENIPFVIEQDAPDWTVLLPGLPNPHFRLHASQKTKYHALCVMSGNFTCLLWQKFFQTLTAEFKLPVEVSHAYLQQIVHNLLYQPEQALTGPMVRGDYQTIQRHLTALDNDPFRQVYQSFVTCYEKMKKVKQYEYI